MRNIAPPPTDLQPGSRFEACSEAMEAAVWQLLDRACEAGWTRNEAILVTSSLLMRFASETRPREHSDVRSAG